MHTSKSDIWMPIYIGDLLGDTQHLTNEQFGIYHKLFYHQWRHGHFSEEDMVAIAGFSSHVSESASSTTQAVLEQRFSRVLATIKEMLIQDRDGRWFSRRCDLEKAKWFEKKRVFVERARKGGVAKAKRMREKMAASSSASSVPEGMLEGCTSPVEVQVQKQKHLTPTPPAVRAGIEPGRADRRAERSRRPQGKSSRQLGRSPRQLGTAPRQLGKSPTQVGKSPRQLGRSPRQLGLAPRQLGNSPRQVAKSEEIKKPVKSGAGGALNGRNGSTPHGGSTVSVAGPPNLIAPGANLGVRPPKADPRESVFEREILEYWKGQNPKHPKLKFQPADYRALEALLEGDHEMDLAFFRELLKNRAQSDVSAAALPRKWLRNIMEYASGPLGKYGKPAARSRSL